MAALIGMLWVLALLPMAANGQDLTSDLCILLPSHIDESASKVPAGKEYVALARSESPAGDLPLKREDERLMELAGLLRLYGECNPHKLFPDANPKVARLYLKASALLGDPAANHEWASLLTFHPLTPEEPAVGVRMLQIEYEEGSPFAAGKLGWAYHMGYGVPQDDNKALELYEYAAQNGMTLWQFLLAHVYEQGYYGLKVDSGKARYWKAFPEKIHNYVYECAVRDLYRGGLSFPKRPDLESQYEVQCAK